MNSSTNHTLNSFFPNSTSSYVFAPVSHNIKIILASGNVIAGAISFIANSLILYFTYKRPNAAQASSFSRQSLIDWYIQSIALTDVLCSLISLPIFTAELFIDFIKTDLVCVVVRYFTMYFPIATILNYVTIGRERYLALDQPFKVYSISVGKKLVAGTWVVAAIVDLLPRPAYKLVRFDLGNNMYTHTCKYDNSTKMYRAIFLSFTLIVWLIPCIYLTVTNFLTLRSLHRQRRAVTGIQAGVLIENARRFKTTSMFVSLIFAFIIPYMLFIFYSGLAMILKLNVSFTSDYITRYLIGLFGYANGVVGASILFYYSNYYRRKLVGMFRRVLETT